MKRGDMGDLGGIIIFFFVAVLFMLIAVVVTGNLRTGFIQMTGGGSNSSYVMNQTDNAINTLGQNGIPILTVGMGLTAIMFAAFIPTSPIFIPLAIMAFAIFLYTGIVLSDLLYSFISQAPFLAIANNWTLVVQMTQNFAWVLGGIGFLLFVALYAKPQAPSFGGGGDGLP